MPKERLQEAGPALIGLAGRGVLVGLLLVLLEVVRGCGGDVREWGTAMRIEIDDVSRTLEESSEGNTHRHKGLAWADALRV